MSDYHIREIDEKKARVIFHIPVPTGTNKAGVPWQDAVAKHKTRPIEGKEPGIISALPDISSTESFGLSRGEIFEVVESVRFSRTTLTNDERIAEIKDACVLVNNFMFPEMSDTLALFGHSGDIK